AEHVGFELAYLVSAGACVGLIGFYLCFVLRSVARGLGFSVGLAGLYGLLYGLLSAEDYALLMGSLLLFAAEHVGFELAYLVSAGACVGLIGFYLCFVLRSVA
ncbi:inner membrane CreD family protein, partial [Escherichia coli]